MFSSDVTISLYANELARGGSERTKEEEIQPFPKHSIVWQRSRKKIMWETRW